MNRRNVCSDRTDRNLWDAFLIWLAVKALCAERDRRFVEDLQESRRCAVLEARRDVDLLLQAKDSNTPDATAALERLVGHIVRQWKPQDCWVKSALRNRAEVEGRSRDAVKRQAVSYGAFMALQDARKVGLVRVGKAELRAVGTRLTLDRPKGRVEDRYAGASTDWVPFLLPTSPIEAAFLGQSDWLSDAHGPIEQAFRGRTRPIELRREHLLHWLRRQAIKEAEAWLLEGSSRRGDPLDDLQRIERVRDGWPHVTEANRRAMDRAARLHTDLPTVEGSALEAVTAAEKCPGERLAEVMSVATGGQQSILELLLSLLGEGLDLPDAKRLAADQLGYKGTGAIDTALSRLRHRVERSRATEP
jgi:hypothetical protein